MEYYHMLNIFLSKHSELRSAHDFDFCSFNDIFSEPFNASFLRDSVHLVEDRTGEYAGFLSNIVDWKPRKVRTLVAANSFLTWTEMIMNNFHSLKGFDFGSDEYLETFTKYLYEEMES